MKMGDEDKENGVVMDTPERTQIANPLSKFEDSPVFNYINSLSPIKPVKSMHFTQTYSSLSFSSIPSVFTSPHATSLKDSKFLRRHQLADPSKPELTSEEMKKSETSEINLTTTQNPLNNSNTETPVIPSNGPTILELRKLSYEPVSPNTTNTSKPAGPLASSVQYTNYGPENGPLRIEPEISKQVSEACDWDSVMINDASELLNFDSPTDTVPYTGPSQTTVDPMSYHDSLMNTQPEVNEDNLLENNEVLKDVVENHLAVATTSLNNFVDGETMENTDNEGGSNLFRGMRRRCLVFEMTGSRRKHLEDISNNNKSETNLTVNPNDNKSRAGNDSSRSCILPGIGLHLNAIASNLMDHKTVKNENSGSGSGRQLIIGPSAGVYGSMGSGQELLTTLSDVSLLENDVGPCQIGGPFGEEGSKGVGFVVGEELGQSQTSPRKKRRRAENGGEPEAACKRCNCKKSKCLKLYCECFAAGVYCVEPCSCQECFNKPIHEETVLATRKQIESRNPLAFAPKVIKSSDSLQEDESTNTPASARHKRGCNCKKSGCLKKYCECYQGGVGCSINCRCEACKNTFGRKDGSEMDLEVSGADECEGMVLHNETEQLSATPATPSRFGRQPIPMIITSSKGKPPRSFLAIGSSSSSSASQRFGNLNPFKGGSGGNKLDNKQLQLQTVGENEIPDILEENNNSPISGVKSCSPNSKRVSPPHSSRMGQRSSRKLILQSIPSFPSLTPNPK